MQLEWLISILDFKYFLRLMRSLKMEEERLRFRVNSLSSVMIRSENYKMKSIASLGNLELCRKTE
jgi:hypothetical protein